MSGWFSVVTKSQRQDYGFVPQKVPQRADKLKIFFSMRDLS